MEHNDAALQLERKFIRSGIKYRYNMLRSDIFQLTAGNKVHKTNLINQGENFRFVFISLMYSDAAEGNVLLNPFEFLVETLLPRCQTDRKFSVEHMKHLMNVFLRLN